MIEWRGSDPVPVRERPPAQAPAVTTATDYATLKSALDAILNSGEQQLSYDEWRNIIFAIHYATDGGADGLALAHEFSARASCYDPDFLDTRVWPYIKSERDVAITERTIYSMASGLGWHDPAIIAGFAIDASAPPAAAPGRFRALTVAEFTQGEPPAWLIDGVLPQAALAVIYGESGSGKTFYALDMVGAIARGLKWRDMHDTKPGRVVYVCAEGVGGFRNRVKAYMQANNLADLDLFVIPDAPNFMLVDDIKAVLASVRACGDVSVIVVDTFAQVMPGANENAGEDVGKAIYHCQQIHRQTGALVVLIHHAGKDASKGARGWSGLRAAADAEIEISRCDDDRTATITKLKDGEDGAVFGFKLAAREIDPFGAKSVKSCTVAHCEAVKKQKKLGPNEEAALLAAQDLCAGGKWAEDKEIIAAVRDAGGLSCADDDVPESIKRALKSLVKRGLVKYSKPMVALA